MSIKLPFTVVVVVVSTVLSPVPLHRCRRSSTAMVRRAAVQYHYNPLLPTSLTLLLAVGQQERYRHHWHTLLGSAVKKLLTKTPNSTQAPTRAMTRRT